MPLVSTNMKKCGTATRAARALCGLCIFASYAASFAPATSMVRRPFATNAAAHLVQLYSHNDDMDLKESTDQRLHTTASNVNKSSFSPWKASPLAATAATAALGAALAMPLDAEAAMSGGRMGGSFSAPRASYSRPAPSSSMRSYPRGGAGYYGGGGPIITPYVVPAPMPFFAPSPFISPFYGGPRVGAISYSRGPGLFDLLFLGGLGFVIWNVVTGSLSNRGGNQWGESSVFDSSASTALGTGTSVLKLNVALNIPNRDDPNGLLSVLQRLSNTASTDSRKGVQNLASQVAVEILRRKSSITAAASQYQHFRNSNDRTAERTFNQWSVQERSKFEKELVSKFGGMDTSALLRLGGRGGSSSVDVGDGKATMAVVTLVLSIQGDSTKIPAIRSMQDVETALRKIASDVKVDDCLLGAEILWTPEDRSEVLSQRDVVVDYPELVNV